MVVSSPRHALQTLRPDPISGIQETYLTSVETQVVATVLLAAVVAFAIGAVLRFRPALRRRYGSEAAEMTAVVGLAATLLLGVYAFTVVWRVTYVVGLTLETVAVDRWTAALLAVSAVVVATAYLGMRLINRSIDKLAGTDAITDHQSEVAYHVSDVGIVLVAGTLLLTLWGVDLTNIFIGAGAITAIVALTARETLRAMLAGFILLFSRPFRVGDWIEIGDRSGVVTDVTIFTTKIQTFGDEHVLVPNDEITNDHLTNFSRNDQLRVELEVGIDYDTDVERARRVIADAVSDLDSIKGTPKPRVIAKRFGDSAIVLELRTWIGDPTMRRRWNAKTDAIEAIQDAFQREGIAIPYPQRVHASRDDSGFRIAGPESEGVGLAASED